MVPLIAFCAFLTVALGVMAVAQNLTERQSALESRLQAIAPGSATYDLRGFNLLRMQNYSSLPFLQKLLAGTPRAERIAEDLDRAGIKMRVGQYVLLSIGLGLVLGLLVLYWLPIESLRLPGAAIALAMGLYLPRLWVKRATRRYRARFDDLLPDALDMIGRSLRAGSGLLPAIQNVIEQIGGPIGAEFGRLQENIAAGLGIDDAFREMDRRIDSKDFHIVTTAILIQREVGGNLTETLKNVTDMMRERVRLRGEVKALVSRQVFSTYALAGAPPAIILILWLLNRQLVEPLFQQTIGWIVLAVAALMEIIGFLIVRKIAKSPIEV